MLVISEPKALEYLLNSTTIINKSSGYKFLHNWLGTGLVTAGGKKWKERTRIIAPAFHNQLFEKYVEHFNSSLDCLIQVLSHEITNESTDAGPFITNCTLDIICESMMGTSVNAQKYPNSEYVKSVKELPRIVVERTFSITQKYDWLYYFSKNYKKEKKALEIIHDFTDSVMRKRKLEMFSKDKECVESFDNFGKKKLSFLDLLLMRKFEENIFSDKELRDEVDVMLFAGHDTTATSTAFVLHCLSSHPKIQQRVYEEINEIFSDYLHKPISYKDLHEMDYLERVIKESMRLYSTALMFGRQVTEDVLFDSILLPKGLTITVLTTGVHKDHETYPDPDTFDPDRFLPQNTRKRNSFTYLPFSAGPRNCIGQKFAMLEMKAIIATVARNFELRPTVPEHKIELVVNTNLKPKNGVVMQLRKRI